MTFTNSITGQNGVLIRQQIESPNYVAGQTGWIIRKDGTVEFNAGTFRGNINLQTSSLVGYTGTPALNDVGVVVSPLSGSDSFGNFWNPGLSVFDSSGNVTGNWGGNTGFTIKNPGAIPGYSMGISVPMNIFSPTFADQNPGSIVGVQSDVVSGHETLQVNGPNALAGADPNLSSIRLKLSAGNAANGADARFVFHNSGGDTVLFQMTNGLVQLNIGFQANTHSTINSSSTMGALTIFQSVNTSGNPGTISIQDFAATSGSFATFVSGDTHSRYVLRTSGNQEYGSGAASLDTIVGRSAAGIWAVLTGSLAVTTVGQGLQIKEGTNAKMGTAVLAAGTVTVANTAVTATSRIFVCTQVGAGTPGAVFVNTRTPGTSFVIKSTSATDTSTVAYLIVEPA